jgi:hypothetical protein
MWHLASTGTYRTGIRLLPDLFSFGCQIRFACTTFLVWFAKQKKSYVHLRWFPADGTIYGIILFRRVPSPATGQGDWGHATQYTGQVPGGLLHGTSRRTRRNLELANLVLLYFEVE